MRRARSGYRGPAFGVGRHTCDRLRELVPGGDRWLRHRRSDDDERQLRAFVENPPVPPVRRGTRSVSERPGHAGRGDRRATSRSRGERLRHRVRPRRVGRTRRERVRNRDDRIRGHPMVADRQRSAGRDRGGPQAPAQRSAAYDERLNLRFRTQLSSTERVLEFGVDRQGNSLVLLDATDRYGSGKVGGIWIDHSGHAGAEFLALENVPSPPYLFLTPRVGNGFFAARNPGPPTTAAWIGQFDAMGEGTAPPDWLMARPVTRLPVVRNGRAYAVIHPARLDAVCHADIEVVAPSGKSCGTAAFPADQSGQFCAGGLFVGSDGTVVGGRAEDASPGSRTFTFRWWTGFLH